MLYSEQIGRQIEKFEADHPVLLHSYVVARCKTWGIGDEAPSPEALKRRKLLDRF